MSKHMTLSDRDIINAGLNNAESFGSIARKLGKAQSTISREVKNHRIVWDKKPYGRSSNRCVNRYDCTLKGVCNPDCTRKCSVCGKCAGSCVNYQQEYCAKLSQAPYVCQACPDVNRCPLEKFRYDPSYAYREYRTTLVEARTGFDLSAQELAQIDTQITPLILNGQSINHAVLACQNSVIVSRRTIYRLVDKCALKARNIDLPRKCKLKPRKGAKSTRKIDKSCRIGRTYADYLSYMAQHPDINPVQMDSVVGGTGTSKVLLSFYFIGDYMPVFLRDNNTAQSVLDWIEFLYNGLGHDDFCAMFPVILTDNGTEFSNPAAIETAPDGSVRTRVFYCDPLASWQKPNVERCHEMYRRILPSGCSFDDLSQSDMKLIASHVNSYARPHLGNKSPIDMLAVYFGHRRAEALLHLLGHTRIPLADVVLSPALIER